jgi:hypothetical protein
MGGGHSGGRQGRASIDTSDTIDVYASKYNERALTPTLQWIQCLINQNAEHFFDYGEVMAHLASYVPRYGCDIVFAKSVLLQKLDDLRGLAKVPESLVVVLNSLYLTKNGVIKLVDVTKDGPCLVFTVMLEQAIDGWTTTETVRYRLRNYSRLKDAWLEPL